MRKKNEKYKNRHNLPIFPQYLYPDYIDFSSHISYEKEEKQKNKNL